LGYRLLYDNDESFIETYKSTILKELKPLSNSCDKNSTITHENPMKKSFISRKLQSGGGYRLRRNLYANRSVAK
jgi:hypothetical protein